MLGHEWHNSMRSLGEAYREIYEKDERSPKERQAAENSYDAFEAETGGDGDYNEWKAAKANKAGKKKTAAERMAAAHDKREIERLNKYAKKNEGVDVYSSLSDAYSSMYTDELLEYDVSDEDAEALLEGKKKCKDGYKYDSKKKKCVKKKKSSSSKKSSKTTIIVGRGYGYGGGHHHHDDDGDKETETGGGGNGGDSGGDGGGDGGGGGGE